MKTTSTALMALLPAMSLLSVSGLSTASAWAGQGSAPVKLAEAPSAPEKSPSKELGVYFRNLKDGQTIAREQKVQFGVHGMKVQPAGKLVEGTGHHHLIIDGEPTPEGQVVPADEKHIHFGKGQEETTIKLAPGQHTLTLQFADGAHRSYGPKFSKTIRVNIK